MGVMNGRPFLPVSVHSGLEFSTVVQGGGEFKEEDVQHLPKYMRLLIRQVFMKRPTSYQMQGVHKGWTDVISS